MVAYLSRSMCIYEVRKGGRSHRGGVGGKHDIGGGSGGRGGRVAVGKGRGILNFCYFIFIFFLK